MQFRARRRPEPQVDITPLVDVVFLLLLFFMVTTQFAFLPGIKLTLPEVSPGKTVSAAARVEIMATAGGALFLDGNPINIDQLADRLRSLGLDPDLTVVVIKADENVSHGRVVKLMDAVRAVGLRKVVLGAQWKHRDGES